MIGGCSRAAPPNSLQLPELAQAQLWCTELARVQLNSAQLNSPATLPTTPTSRAAGASAKAQHKQNPAMAAMIVCAENVPTAPRSRAAPSAWPKHDTNNTPGNGRNGCEFTHDTHVVRHHRPGPNTTNNTPSNGHNDCVEFTHNTHKSRACACARPLAKHNTNKKLATAATIVRNLPMHPQSRAAPAQCKHNTNKSQQWPQRFCGI